MSQIEIRVAYNGVTKVLDNVQPHAAVQSLLQRALELFGVTDRPHAQALFREDGTEISLTESMETTGLKNGSLIYLQPRTQQGGLR